MEKLQTSSWVEKSQDVEAGLKTTLQSLACCTSPAHTSCWWLHPVGCWMMLHDASICCPFKHMSHVPLVSAGTGEASAGRKTVVGRGCGWQMTMMAVIDMWFPCSSLATAWHVWWILVDLGGSWCSWDLRFCCRWCKWCNYMMYMMYMMYRMFLDKSNRWQYRNETNEVRTTVYIHQRAHTTRTIMPYPAHTYCIDTVCYKWNPFGLEWYLLRYRNSSSLFMTNDMTALFHHVQHPAPPFPPF